MDSREQFEAAMLARAAALGRSHEKHYFNRSSNGDYLNPIAQSRWEGWQASREALVVELPDGWFDDRHGEYLATHTQIEQALSAAGIKWK